MNPFFLVYFLKYIGGISIPFPKMNKGLEDSESLMYLDSLEPIANTSPKGISQINKGNKGLLLPGALMNRAMSMYKKEIIIAAEQILVTFMNLKLALWWNLSVGWNPGYNFSSNIGVPLSTCSPTGVGFDVFI